MRRALAAVLVFSLVLPVAISAQSLEGMWRLVETEDRGGPDAGVTPAQGGLLGYSGSHFMFILDTNPEPRPIYENPTADQFMNEILSGWGAMAGHYEVSGSTITYHRIMASTNPAIMQNPDFSFTREFRITGNTLETSTTDDEGVTSIWRYQRVD